MFHSRLLHPSQCCGIQFGNMYTISYLNCVVIVWVWNRVSNQCNLNSENRSNSSLYNTHYRIIFLMVLCDQTHRYTSKFALYMHSQLLFEVFPATIASSQSTKIVMFVYTQCNKHTWIMFLFKILLSLWFSLRIVLNRQQYKCLVSVKQSMYQFVKWRVLI